MSHCNRHNAYVHGLSSHWAAFFFPFPAISEGVWITVVLYVINLQVINALGSHPTVSTSTPTHTITVIFFASSRQFCCLHRPSRCCLFSQRQYHGLSLHWWETYVESHVKCRLFKRSENSNICTHFTLFSPRITKNQVYSCISCSKHSE